MTAEKLKGNVELYRFEEVDDTYSGTCVLVYEGGVWTIKGLLDINLNKWRELNDYFKSKGVGKVYYERKKFGKTLNKVIRVK